MRITTLANGARLFTMENAAGTRLTVTDAGASATALVVRGTDILLGWGDPTAYRINKGSLGATVGRCANRIAGARFTLNGREYLLAKNEGENNLHSGPDAWKLRRWETASAEGNRVEFLLDSPDGDQGFPGRVRMLASYELTEDDRVVLTYRAETDADTVLNVTNHAYFNLNGHDSGDIAGHTLRLFAGHYTPAGPDLIPTGEIAPVAGTPFDFRESRPIGRHLHAEDPRIAAVGGYDHNFCLDGEGFRPAAVLRGDKTGITLTVYTDRPGVQLYTANTFRTDEGKNGAAYRPWGAVCLETQNWPDAVNRPDFPSCILPAGESFVSKTEWALTQG